jgi:hypothetical protein
VALLREEFFAGADFLSWEGFSEARGDRALAGFLFRSSFSHRVALAARRCCFAHYDGFRFSVR